MATKYSFIFKNTLVHSQQQARIQTLVYEPHRVCSNTAHVILTRHKFLSYCDEVKYHHLPNFFQRFSYKTVIELVCISVRAYSRLAGFQLKYWWYRWIVGRKTNKVRKIRVIISNITHTQLFHTNARSVSITVYKELVNIFILTLNIIIM